MDKSCESRPITRDDIIAISATWTKTQAAMKKLDLLINRDLTEEALKELENDKSHSVRETARCVSSEYLAVNNFVDIVDVKAVDRVTAKTGRYRRITAKYPQLLASVIYPEV